MSGHENCKIVVFSNKAYNAIINETFRKDPVETGGILMGHVLSNGCWIVMEVIPPGLKAIHQRAYFEYDTEFVNYMAISVSKQYKMELDVLGLWHRHPGSMDVFSGTDDGTNATFANMSAYGAISGLVNVDPKFRFTLRHVSYPLDYQIVDVEVGDDLIPEQYFELKYSLVDNLSPTAPIDNNTEVKTQIAEPEKQNGNGNNRVSEKTYDNNVDDSTTPKGGGEPFFNPDDYVSKDKIRNVAKRILLVVIAAVLCLAIGLWVGSKSKNNSKRDEPVGVSTGNQVNGRSGVANTSAASTSKTDNGAAKNVATTHQEKGAGTSSANNANKGGSTDGTN